jgi:anaphase-promoting complex subunit 5
MPSEMMDEAPPPTEHIVRPHHIGLLSILSLAFKDGGFKEFPSPFTLHLYRCLLNEISEVFVSIAIERTSD